MDLHLLVKGGLYFFYNRFEKRERFIDIVSKKYIERYSANSNGRINVQMVRLEVEAEKK